MKRIETSKGVWKVVEINSIEEGQFYVDTLSSYHYKLSEITEEQCKEIVYKYEFTPTHKEELINRLKHSNIEITPNTYIFKI